MAIRIIHGNGDLIGAAFQGISEGAQAYQRGSLANREMDDRVAKTEAYAQRVKDAKALADARAELDAEEEAKKQQHDAALRQAAQGLAGTRVNQMSGMQGWTKDDEAFVRATFADPSLTPEEQQDIADSHLDLVAQRIAEENENLEQMKLRDRLMRAAQPDASGLPLIDEETAAAYQERIDAGESSWRVRADFDKEIKAARINARTEREMAQASSVFEQAKSMQMLNQEQADLIDDYEALLEAGEITPRQAIFRAQTVMAGNEDQLKEYERIITDQARQEMQQRARAQAEADAANMALGGNSAVQAGPAGLVEGARMFISELPRDMSRKEKERMVEEWAAKNGTTTEQLFAALDAAAQGQVPTPGEAGFVKPPEEKSADVLAAPSTRGKQIRATKDDLITRLP